MLLASPSRPGLQTRAAADVAARVWVPKLDTNRERDRRNEDALRASGWDVRVIWECEARDKDALSRIVEACKAAPFRKSDGRITRKD